MAPQLKDVATQMQEDLSLPNHLSGQRKKYLQLRFDSTRDLMTVRKTLLPAVHANRRKAEANAAYADMDGEAADKRADGWLERIEDIREHALRVISGERRCASQAQRSPARLRVSEPLAAGCKAPTRTCARHAHGLGSLPLRYDVPFHHRVAIDTERRCGK